LKMTAVGSMKEICASGTCFERIYLLNGYVVSFWNLGGG
jgi:hypothetical protein